MKRATIFVLCVSLLFVGAGCVEQKGDDYSDAPTEIKEGSLDYQDYKEAGCPYLDGSLDQETMEKCNEWIRQNNVTVS
jgi:hypothetical protein